MMIQVTCRGYATAQFMQPEPAKYAHAPNLEAKTFMQPEQAYYAHHPGRFFYIKDEETGELFSAPYEPVRADAGPLRLLGRPERHRLDRRKAGHPHRAALGLPTDDVVELWSLQSDEPVGPARRVSVYPYFPIGYMSWMNQSAEYRADLGGIVASSVTPYQKVAGLLQEQGPQGQDLLPVRERAGCVGSEPGPFEGEGGLHAPDALQQEQLAGGDARYETPVAVVQYRLALAAGDAARAASCSAPPSTTPKSRALRERYLNAEQFAAAAPTTRPMSPGPRLRAHRDAGRRNSTTSSTTGCRARCSTTATSIASAPIRRPATTCRTIWA
jgi:cellobionic acid phosphorylase